MEPQEAQQGGGSIGDAIVDIDKKLGMLAQAAAQSKEIPEGTAEQLNALREAFTSLVEGALGGGQKAPQGPVSPEAGVNPNAVPMGA